MGKALRVFVIILLMLSIGALTLGILLFNKREMLKGRTQFLENYLIRVASTLEAADVEKGAAGSDPERDVSPVTPEVIASPERARFWENYKYHLEETDRAMLDLNKRRDALMQYYKVDPSDGKVVRDPTYGTKLTTGDGTMHDLLEEVLKRAESQYNSLNETREQLRVLREELIATINDLNSQKSDLRDKLARIVQLEQQIADLERRVSELQQNIAMLEEEKQSLKDDIAERDRNIDDLNKVVAEQKIGIDRLNAEIVRLRVNIDRGRATSGLPTENVVFFSPGVKGAVEAVNTEWNFVVLNLTKETFDEILGRDRDKDFRPAEMMIKRGDGSEKFVTKIRLRQLKPSEGLAVADIMSPWQQLPVQSGDQVFQ